MNELIVLTNLLIDDVGIMRFPHFTKVIKSEIVIKKGNKLDYIDFPPIDIIKIESLNIVLRRLH